MRLERVLTSLRHRFPRVRPALARGWSDPPRAARARRAVEQLLVLALAASLVAARLARPAWAPDPAAPDTAASGTCEPWTSLAVDVATDGPSRLRLLPGLGAVRTRALLDDRTRHGPVTTVEGLRRIRGFGAKTVGALRAAGAVVGPARPPSAGTPRSSPGPATAPGDGATSVPVGLVPQAQPQAR